MYGPSEIDLLTAWERGHTALEQASVPLFLLLAVYPDDAMELFAQLTIGQRDAHLLRLREHLFGRSITGISECICCGAVLEVSLDLETLKLQSVEAEPAEDICINEQEYEIMVRLPNTLDVLAISSFSSAEAAKIKLLDRIVLSSMFRSVPLAVADLPEDIVQFIDSSLNSADPQANIQLNLECVGCGTVNEILFDIGYLLWKEVDTWAIRLLRDIHELASRYGWSESAILKLNPWRRRCYLEMLRS